jgi:polyisoprenoid-binding protein YceI/rhodanese-related sulfurtransferase
MNTAPSITASDLRAKLDGATPPLLIDVLPEEEFRAAHLPGAKNACVYDVTFLDDVQKLTPQRDVALVVYGSRASNLASATAAEKLLAAGYTHVSDFRGGLEEWRAVGQPCEGDPSRAPRETPPRDGLHTVDLEKSRVEWTGRSLTGAHSGTVKLRRGEFEVRGGQPVRASFTLDMQSIENSDIEESEMREMLIQHLKSDDFFDVEKFPEAQFNLTRVEPNPDVTPGCPNAQVTGELTLKDVKRELTFAAILGPTPDGTLAADAHFDIDRTLWNVRYGSGKFYEKLGKHLVNDTISLGLKIVTLPQS